MSRTRGSTQYLSIRTSAGRENPAGRKPVPGKLMFKNTAENRKPAEVNERGTGGGWIAFAARQRWATSRSSAKLNSRYENPPDLLRTRCRTVAQMRRLKIFQGKTQISSLPRLHGNVVGALSQSWIATSFWARQTLARPSNSVGAILNDSGTRLFGTILLAVTQHRTAFYFGFELFRFAGNICLL
jgi:hypothetical protein